MLDHCFLLAWKTGRSSALPKKCIPKLENGGWMVKAKKQVAEKRKSIEVVDFGVQLSKIKGKGILFNVGGQQAKAAFLHGQTM